MVQAGFLGAAPPYRPSLWDTVALAGAGLRSDPRYLQMAQESIKAKQDQAQQAASAAIVQRLLGSVMGDGAPVAPSPAVVQPDVARPMASDPAQTTESGLPMADVLPGDAAYMRGAGGAPAGGASPPTVSPRQRGLAMLAALKGDYSSANTILNGNQEWSQATDGSFFDKHGSGAPAPTANRTNVNGTIVDMNDPGNTNRVIGEAPVKGAMPVFANDGSGRVVDWTLPSGAKLAIAESARASSDATNASDASYAGPRAFAAAAGTGSGTLVNARALAKANAGGTAEGEDPYKIETVQTPTGMVTGRRGDVFARGPVEGRSPGVQERVLNRNEEDQDFIDTANRVGGRLQGHIADLRSGRLRLDPASNAASMLKIATGRGDASSSRYATFRSDMQDVVNDSLRLNKGTQTEGDAQRAATALMGSLSDGRAVMANLQRIEHLNQQAIQQHQARVTARTPASAPPRSGGGFGGYSTDAWIAAARRAQGGR